MPSRYPFRPSGAHPAAQAIDRFTESFGGSYRGAQERTRQRRDDERRAMLDRVAEHLMGLRDGSAEDAQDRDRGDRLEELSALAPPAPSVTPSTAGFATNDASGIDVTELASVMGDVSAMRRPGPPPIPGAYTKETGFYLISKPRTRTMPGQSFSQAQDDRFVDVGGGRYLDTEQTPEARAGRVRAEERHERTTERRHDRELVASQRQEDIRLRGQESAELARLRAELQASQAAARDERTAGRQDARDDRVDARADRTVGARTAAEEERDNDRRDAFILRESTRLMQPQPIPGRAGRTKPGLSFEEAEKEARRRVTAVMGTRTGWAATRASGSTQSGGGATGPTPERAAMDALRLIEDKTITLEHALSSPHLSERAKQILRERAGRPR